LAQRVCREAALYSAFSIQHSAFSIQIDLCQLLNRWPEFSYESEGGVDVEASYRALQTTRQPARSRSQFLRWFVAVIEKYAGYMQETLQ